MRVWMQVDPGAAVLAGKSKSGVLPLVLSDADIASLTEDERRELAKCSFLDDDEQPRSGIRAVGDPPISEASLSELRRCLQTRINYQVEQQRIKAREAAEVAANTKAVLESRKTIRQRVHRSIKHEGKTHYVQVETLQPHWPFNYDDSIINSHEAAVWLKELEIHNQEAERLAVQEHLADLAAKQAAFAAQEAQKRRFQDALKAFLLSLDMEDVTERVNAGLMPEEESLGLLRDFLFENLDHLPRYKKLGAADIEHEEDCYEATIEFSVVDAASLTKDEWESLSKVRDVLPNGATATARRHVATCELCERDAVRMSILVTIEWHGRQFSREYAV